MIPWEWGVMISHYALVLLEVLLCDVAAAGADAGDGAADADVALEAHHDGAVHRGHHGDLWRVENEGIS